ncbi:hypothetical protein BKA59DRAFT_409235 [Fusarium tricinctum]|uniref:Protein CAP22 n=1 Tax=Fusarium tricinctum TaxID=61284 RepID=A0A8K0W541_9HYPO|nr:hypothetical protein BKA59DRAFT_409235 [Fusarium tricinctum]
MRPIIFLASLAAVIPTTRAEELRAKDVPSACKTICQPIIDLTNICDVDPKEADKNSEGDKTIKLRLHKRKKAEESIEANCICSNKSFDVAAVMALCASCMVQNSKDTEVIDVDKIMSQCSFTSTSYVRSATAIVSGVQVQATKPATTVARPSDSTSMAGASSSTNSSDNGAGKMPVSIVSIAWAGLVLLFQF